MNWVSWVILFLLLSIPATFLVACIIYTVLLRRTGAKKWGRSASMPESEEYMKLYEQALSWHEMYKASMRNVEIENDGLRLAGEYFDFGADKAVIIIPGRMESCHYSCHYAEPYRKAGWNVLTIDGRAHGLSEGKTNSLGYKEYRDILAWAKMLHETEKNRVIVLHGICIGSSTAVFAIADSSCPDYVGGIAVDGLYQRFYDSCRNHMLEDHRPIFPFLYELMILIRVFSHADVVHDGPICRIANVKKPILFLHSREDLFSTPDKAEELYQKCPSAGKQIHWFEHGGHSRIRITDPTAYDRAVESFFSSDKW